MGSYSNKMPSVCCDSVGAACRACDQGVQGPHSGVWSWGRRRVCWIHYGQCDRLYTVGWKATFEPNEILALS